MNVEEALNQLHGDPETFRPLLQPEAILARICRTAKIQADHECVPPWSIISDLTGHGSGVSNAIYNVYGDKEND